MSLETQFVTLSLMLASGLALGVLFDTYRVLSGQLRLPRWLIAPLDIVYWIAATILVFLVLYYGNQGQLRIFVFAGLLAGVLLYYRLLSSFIMKLVLQIVKLVKACARIVVKVADAAIVTPIVGLYRIFIIFLGFLAAVSIFLYKIVLQLIYPLWAVTKRLFKPLTTRLVLPKRIAVIFEKVRNAIRRLF